MLAGRLWAALPDEPVVDHGTLVASNATEPREYLLGLGAYQKIGGRWRHKHSESVRGQLTRYTWLIDEGYTTEDAYGWALQLMPPGSEELYSCRGRACGSSAQWANRVFGQRLLYGHDDRQQYSVWRFNDGTDDWSLVIYAVDRANRRHYLHLDILQHDQ